MEATPKTITLIPDAHLLMSSLRSVGYKPETAIADILDNSISAGASEIQISFIWNEEHSSIIIVDNGRGMDQDELIKSMKIGSADPNMVRNSDDLGRFGMGMKTAAFSLGRKLMVITKCNGTYANACWDLEYIEKSKSGEWQLLIEDNNDLESSFALMQTIESGTVIVIENLDRIVASNALQKAKASFYKLAETVDMHLGLIFHRFIEENGLRITLNGKEIIAWDPYILDNSATQELGEEQYFEGDKEVLIQPYVLPHKTKFSTEQEYEMAGGPRGWTAHQGIYVYRNRRLLVYGTWFDILRKEPAFNLARIKLDIDATSDNDWKIDIKKSAAAPPLYIRDLIERAVSICTETSAKVYNSRGAYSKNVVSPHLGYVWEQRKNRAGQYSFHINKKHPLLIELNKKLDDQSEKDMNAYLCLVENYAPFLQSGVVDHLQSGSGSNQVNVAGELEKQTDLKEIKGYIRSFMNKDFSKEEVQSIVLGMANFRYLRTEILKIFEENSYD